MQKTDLSKEQIDILRHLPESKVRNTFTSKGLEKPRSKKKAGNAIEVLMYEFGATYKDAIAMLAEAFPEALSGSADKPVSFDEAIRLAKEKAEKSGLTFTDYDENHMATDIRKEICKWWNALHLEKIKINVALPKDIIMAKIHGEVLADHPDGRKRHAVYAPKNEECDLYDVLRFVPSLMRTSLQGDTGINPVHIFCTPFWPDGLIGLMVDDASEEIIKKYHPTAVVATSDRSRQAFFIIPKKYPEKKFYDFVQKTLNQKYGDPKVTTIGHNTRICGFDNQKREKLDKPGKAPRAKLLTSTIREPVELLQYIEYLRKVWLEKRLEKRIEERESTSYENGMVISKKTDSSPMEKEKFMASLTKEPLSDDLSKIGLRARDFFRLKVLLRDKYENRSAIDFNVARTLYFAEATPNQVYTFLLENMLQNDEQVWRKREGEDKPRLTQRLFNAKDADREARKIAAEFAPSHLVCNNWRSEHPEADVDMENRYPEIFIYTDEVFERFRNRTLRKNEKKM